MAGPIAGNSGACCECAEFAASGCACGGGLPCSLDCRQKSGFASLCGIAEFTDVSDPPKLYRTLTNSGSLVENDYGNSDCSGDPTPITTNYDLVCSYDKDTCFESETGTTGTCGETNLGDDTDTGPFLKTVNQTSSTSAGTGLCLFLSVIRSIKYTGTWKTELTDEDTEGDAIDRANAEIPDWAGCSFGGSAFITDRSGTGDTSFAFRKAQTKCSWSAVIGQTYNVRINFARRLLGSSGPYLDLGMPYEGTFTASESLEHTDWIDVPNEAGWETVASGCVVTIQP